MDTIVTDNKKQLEALCATYRVARLELFGSATGDAFDPTSSDLDFLVLFDDLEPVAAADCYFGLWEELKSLFGRPVDLVMLDAVDNPYFLREIESQRRLLHAAWSTLAAL